MGRPQGCGMRNSGQWGCSGDFRALFQIREEVPSSGCLPWWQNISSKHMEWTWDSVLNELKMGKQSPLTLNMSTSSLSWAPSSPPQPWLSGWRKVDRNRTEIHYQASERSTKPKQTGCMWQKLSRSTTIGAYEVQNYSIKRKINRSHTAIMQASYSQKKKSINLEEKTLREQKVIPH